MYPWINEHVADIGEDPADEPENGGESQYAHEYHVIPADDGVQAQQAHAGDFKDLFYQYGSGENQGEDAAEARGYGDQRITEGMGPDGPVECGAFGQDRAYIILADLFQQAVLHQQGKHCEVAYHVAGDRQKHVHEQVFCLVRRGQFNKILRGKTADRKNVPQPFCRPRQKHLQQHAEGECGDGIADEHQDTAGDIKPGAVFDGLGYSQRDADQVGQEEPGQSENQRNRKSLDNELDDRFIRVFIGVDRHADPVGNQPLPVALQQGFVETEMLLQGLALVRGDTAGSGGRGCINRSLANPAHLHNCLLHRSAGDKLAQGKTDEGNADEGGDDQQQAPDDVVSTFHCYMITLRIGGYIRE